MLASTVQFSNNDQPPTNPAWDRHQGNNDRSLRTQQRARHQQPRTTRSTRRSAVLGPTRKPPMPNIQRSTHEQPHEDIRPELAICSLERR